MKLSLIVFLSLFLNVSSVMGDDSYQDCNYIYQYIESYEQMIKEDKLELEELERRNQNKMIIDMTKYRIKMFTEILNNIKKSSDC